ncbi:MAG: cytochrome d ubiquinol oxidase subunit II [Steroidobacteraceae bacterium]
MLLARADIACALSSRWPVSAQYVGDAAHRLWRAVIRRDRDAAPFVLTLTFFALGSIGLVLGIWPNIVPPSLSIWEASSPPSSQGFVMVGLIVLLPVRLGYTYWSYGVFKGKVSADSGYH